MLRNYVEKEKVYVKVTDENGQDTYVEQEVNAVKTEEVGMIGFLKGLRKNGPVTVTKTGEVKKSNLVRNVAIGLGVVSALVGGAYVMSKKDENNQPIQPQYPSYPEIPAQPTYTAPQLTQTVEAPTVSEPVAPETITFTETLPDGTTNSETIDVTEYDKF